RAWGLEGLRRREVEEEGKQAVPPAVLVQTGGPMPHPLPGDEDRHRAVELELHHLARCRMPMTAEVADEPAGLARAACPVAVRHAGGPLDVLVGAHVVDEGDEAVVENGEVEAEDLLGLRAGGTAGLHGWREGMGPAWGG